jgi:hypothetical protein
VRSSSCWASKRVAKSAATCESKCKLSQESLNNQSSSIYNCSRPNSDRSSSEDRHGYEREQMSFKLKAIGLGLLAATMVSSLAAMNASATTGGHFVSELAHTEIVGTETATHTGSMINHGLSGAVACGQSSATTTATASTLTEIVGTAAVSNCITSGTSTNVSVDVNGCQGRATVAPGNPSTTEQTGHLECPIGKAIEITHPNCTIKIHPQTINTGVTYTRVINANGKHEITGDTNTQFSTTRHGLCQFIAPTNGTGTLIGSAVIRGFNPATKAQVSITAT